MSPMAIRGLPVVEIDYSRRCGIYFLCDADVVVYVGQSVNVVGRVHSHTDKQFDSVFYLACSQADLLQIESYWIDRLKPKYNKSQPTTRPQDYSQLASYARKHARLGCNVKF